MPATPAESHWSDGAFYGVVVDGEGTTMNPRFTNIKIYDLTQQLPQEIRSIK